MMKANDLIALFERMHREHWAYRWGGAKTGCVDCSGAFVYAYKRLGAPKPEHSSNYIARRAIAGPLLPMRAAKPGYAAFKWRAERADTPKRWRDGRGDFYHIGLVGRDGRILNAKSTKDGFSSDSAKGWQFCAPLAKVRYDAQDA